MAQALIQYQIDCKTILQHHLSGQRSTCVLPKFINVRKTSLLLPSEATLKKRHYTQYPESDVKPQALREMVAISYATKQI
jgi:hypothetical protein